MLAEGATTVPGSGPVRDRLEAYKPAASARTHLLLAAAMWTVVGAVLVLLGVKWTLNGKMPLRWLLLAAAVVAGGLKARFVLRRAADRMIERIETRGDGRCIGGFLSIRSWAFVALMAGAGRLLRGELLPRAVVGLIYVAVGTALLLAGRRLWHAWHHHHQA
jgi:hypothetical protein